VIEGPGRARLGQVEGADLEPGLGAGGLAEQVEAIGRAVGVLGQGLGQDLGTVGLVAGDAGLGQLDGQPQSSRS
jgi:hypothetical protein